MKILNELETTYKKALLSELYSNNLITLREYQNALKELSNIDQNKLAIEGL